MLLNKGCGRSKTDVFPSLGGTESVESGVGCTSADVLRGFFALLQVEFQTPCGRAGSKVMLLCRCALASHVSIVISMVMSVVFCAPKI